MQCLVYLTNFSKPLNDPSVIDMFYQCTDNPGLLFQLTRNDRESKDPNIQAKFNSNTIVTTTLQYLQDNRIMSASCGTQRKSRQPYSFKNCAASSFAPLIPQFPNPAIEQVNYLNNKPMLDTENYVFGMRCDTISQIQDCLVYSVAKLNDFLPNNLDPKEADMTNQYIQALAKCTQKPPSYKSECLFCLLADHPFEECEVLGNYKFLKAHMRELSLLWQRLCMMIKEHVKIREAKQKKKVNAIQARQPPPPRQSNSFNDNNSTLGGNSLQGSLASLSFRIFHRAKPKILSF